MDTPSPRKRSFASDFRVFFVRGLVILLPSILTVWILWAAFQFVQRNVAEPINAGLRQATLQVAPRVMGSGALPEWFAVTPEQIAATRADRARLGQIPLTDEALRAQIRAANLKEWWNGRWYLRVIGLAVAIVLLYLAGALLGGFLGRSLYEPVERWITRLPIFRQVYPSVKQVVDFLLGQRTMAFNRVVLIEYPRKGVWSIGLVTGPAMPAAERAIGADCLSVFMPSSPTPFTGWTLTVPRDAVIDLPISIDEALKFVVSGGVLAPGLTGPQDRRPLNGREPAPGGALASGPGEAKMARPGAGPTTASGSPHAH